MFTTEAINILPVYKQELSAELQSILDYWMKYMPDNVNGGFFASLDNDNIPDPGAPKGVVLNSRILWTFSSAYLNDRNPEYLQFATRAYKYIVDHFIDRKYGGVYWSVDSKGEIVEPKKQIYGLAFAIYGLTEYYRASGDMIALHLARDIYERIEEHSFDKKHGGYLEAFTQGWKVRDDLRLSDKDDNGSKTMNTHLHIIEAYANLYRASHDQKVLASVKHLLNVFDQYIIDSKSFHLHLFMEKDWTIRPSVISFGHDIEAAWLLQQCAEITDEQAYILACKDLAIKIADAASEGLDQDGGLWYEYDTAKDEWIKEKHSWPQAEAMIGFFNAYQVSGDEKYLNHSINSWNFIKKYIRDRKKGEWFWGVHADHSIMKKEKAGFWKCPYHNARACMELINRISSLE